MAKIPPTAAPTGFAAMDPSLQTALIGAGVGGLGGLITGRDRLRDTLLYAALGAGLGGGGRYLYEHGGEMFAPAGKKEKGKEDKPTQPTTLPTTQPTGDMFDISRRLLGYGAGGAAGGMLQQRFGRLKPGGTLARVPGARGLFTAQKPTRGIIGKGIVPGVVLTAILDYLTSTRSPLRG